MSKLTGFGTLAIIGAAVLMPSNFARAQVDGAVQYPPASIGKDAQPPPPAGMVPQSVSPKRIEYGVSGSSTPPGDYTSRSPRSSDADQLPVQRAPTRGLPPEAKAPSSQVGN